MPMGERLVRRLRRERGASRRDGGEDRRGAPRLPPSSSAPGSRVVPSGFFDAYPRFYETSETFASPGRLALRHEAIIGENRDLFAGRRVLDIASHDGRWSFAALQAGATSVVGIEGRPELVESARENFAHYGIEPGRYEFVADDIFHALGTREWEFDVVLCLGFLYHTLRYNELLARIRQCRPTHLVIDTEVARDDRALVQLRVESVAPQRNAVADDLTHGHRVLSGRPSVPGLELMVGAYGFVVERYSDWAGLIRDNPEHADQVRNYVRGRRVTARCRATP